MARAALASTNRHRMAATAGIASISDRMGSPLTGTAPSPSLPGRQDRAASRTHIHIHNPIAAGPRAGRSEEHTSELQSLMRISYAVFCLKKKKTTTQHIKKSN